MRKFYYLVTGCLLLTALSLNAQETKGTIKGKLVDSAGKQVLPLATITIFKAADTAIVTYRLSDPQGEFKVPGLPLNIGLRAVITFSGYSVFRKEFQLTPEQPQLDMGAVNMMTNTTSLDEVLVIAERPPVTVKKDTIEFNASAFSTLPTALVEDLLKKLPGVQVDADGNITVNGKRVNRIMVDGRDFFGTDPKMATRNLPANIIDRVQVAEDKDEKELNPDKPAGEIGQVINLKLKKGIKKGWFGKAYAGAGTDKRYEAGGIVNLFRDTLQVSLLGFTNNLNRAGFGFNDIRSLGGFDRTGINSISISSGGALSVNGINFGGTGEGINTTTGGGLNMNHVLANGLTLNTQYFYGQTRNDIEELNKRRQFLGDTILETNTIRNELLESFNHRIGFGLKGNIDSLTRFEFKPNLVFINQESLRNTVTTNESNVDNLLNKSRNDQNLKGKDVQYSHNFMFFKNFRKKGRTLNITNWINTNNLENDQVNEAQNVFFENGFSDTTLLDQLRNRQQDNFSISLGVNYTEPISKQTSLRFGFQSMYLRNKDQIGTFTKNGNGKYEVPEENFSNILNRKSWRNNLSAAFVWRYKQLSVTATASVLAFDIKNQFSKSINDVDQNFTYLLPALNINWKALNFNYSVNVSPAEINDLQPIPDNTNPLYILQGNPDLLPTKHHSYYFHFNKSITAKTLYVSAYLSGSVREDGVTRSRTVNPDGTQVTKPVNVDGQNSFYTNFNISKQYKLNKNFQFSFGGGYNVNFSRNYLIINARRGYVKNFGLGPNVFTNFNWKDKIEFNVHYNLNYNKSDYESQDFNDLNVTSHYSMSELVIRWPKNIVWETSLNYRYNSQAAPGIQKSVALINGGIIFLFLKDQKGNLKLSAYDLLNQNTNVSRQTNENAIIDRQINFVQRYYMLTFTYNIRNFNAGKVGGSQRFFRF
jgi:hypothetical protein